MNKYNAIKTQIDGTWFDSKKEAARYQELLLLERAGEISKLELQPKYGLVINDKPVKIRSKGYPNGRRSSYRADFRYLDTRTAKTVVEDVKGFDTGASRLRRAVVECIYDIEIKII